MSSMIQLFYALTVLGTLIGGYEFLSMLSNAESAPQQAAGAAMAIGWALIPYILARSCHEVERLKREMVSWDKADTAAKEPRPAADPRLLVLSTARPPTR